MSSTVAAVVIGAGTAGPVIAARLSEDPGLEVALAKDGGANQEALQARLRQESGFAFHPVGAARMGAADDPLAVVDLQLRVRGVSGLRVADTAVHPMQDVLALP